MSVRYGLSQDNKSFFVQIRRPIRARGSVIKVSPKSEDSTKTEFSYVGENTYNFSVPVTGHYRLEAWGASGGGGDTGPKGAYSKSIVLLSKDEIVKVLVGEKGFSGKNSGNDIYCGGGGGGTFISKDNKPLCVAGGGGSFTYFSYDSQTSFSCGQSSQLGGDPGTGQGELKMGGKSGATHAAGGGGFIGNGEDGTKYGKGGISFINGGWRQKEGTKGEYGYGGFGGGGSNNGNCGSAAGGGGYSGGSASSSASIQGGGGGSYFEGDPFSGEKPTSISGCDSFPTKPSTDEHGFAVITLLSRSFDAPIMNHSKRRCSPQKLTLWIFITAIGS